MLSISTLFQKLIDFLVAAIRLQRHLACRIIIATQEPTIALRLLNLCSITLVHRFSSPEWLKMLKVHLAAAAADDAGAVGRGVQKNDKNEEAKKEEEETEEEESPLFGKK
jgi:hypothetical protein